MRVCYAHPFWKQGRLSPTPLWTEDAPAEKAEAEEAEKAEEKVEKVEVPALSVGPSALGARGSVITVAAKEVWVGGLLLSRG